MNRRRILAALLAVALAVPAVLAIRTSVSGSWNVRTSLLDLLPRGNGRIHDVLALVEGRTGKELVMLVGHTDPETAQRLAARAKAIVDSSGGVDSRDDQAPEGMQRAWWELLRDHLPRLLTDSLEIAADNRDTALLSRQILSGLYLPYSILPPRDDPFQIASARLSGLSRPGWSLCGRRPCKPEGDTTWIMVRTHLRGGAFDAGIQQKLLPALERARIAVATAKGSLLCQGVVLHAAYGREQTQSDMDKVGLGSALGILLVLWVAFRSPMPFLAGVATVLAGLGAGVAATHALFGGIHALTLAFGASITGLCADYSLFILVRRSFSGKGWKPKEVVSVHWQSLSLAVATTLLSFAGLAASGFPGLVEIAVFSLVGLATSWLAALVVLPIVFRAPVAAPSGTLRAIARTSVLARRPWVRRATGLAALACALGLFLLRGDDDVRRLQKPSPALVSQDDRVSRLLQEGGAGPLLLVEAPDPESLLTRLEMTDSVLSAERAAGRVGTWISLSMNVPSTHRQRLDSARLEVLLREPLRSVPIKLGIEASALDSLELRSRRGVAPLLLRQWLSSDASWGSRDLLVDTSPWRAAVAVEGAKPGWSLPRPPSWTVQVDASRLYTTLLQGQRRRSAWLVAGMYAVVLAGLWTLLGRRRALSVIVPPLLAAAATLGLLGWMGVPLHFFGLMALTLVLGAGVDYALFLEARVSEDDAGYASVVLCAATALLSFGVLWLASSPALSQFGLVTAIGLSWSMLLSPWAPRLSRGGGA